MAVIFTNPTVEAVAHTLIDAYGGNVNLKMIGEKPYNTMLLCNADPKFQEHLLEQAAMHERAAKALRAAHTFNDMAQTLGTQVDEEAE